MFQDFCVFYYPTSTDYQDGPCPVFIEAFYYVLGNIDPVNHCDEIGACSAALPSSAKSNELMLNPNEKGIFCQTCEQVINQLKEQLDDPKFEAQLKKKVRELCDYLKVVDQDKECKHYVFQYINQAFDFIRNMSPVQYCQSIQLCDKQQAKSRGSLSAKLPTLLDFSDFGIETSVKVDDITTKNIDSTAKTPTCPFCKTLVKEMFKFLKDNRTEETIRDGLDQVCKLLYSDGNKIDQCENLVASYTKQFVELLIDGTDPELICMILGQCVYPESSTMINTLPPVTPAKALNADPISLSQFLNMLDDQIKVGSLRSCVECKLLIKYLQDAVRDPKSQEQLKQWMIENLCDKLGDEDLKNSCQSMVETNSEAFFNAIVYELNPHVTCVEVGACKKSSRHVLTIGGTVPFEEQQLQDAIRKIIPEPAQGTAQDAPLFLDPITALFHVRATDACDQCVDLVTRFDEYLSTHSFDHDVTSLIDNVCGNIPSEKAKNSCSDFVRKYGQIIIQAIENMDNPKQLCSKIMLC